MNLNLSNLSQILADGIFDQNLDSDLRKKILDNIPEKYYDVACDVFNETRQAYFELGLKTWLTLKG